MSGATGGNQGHALIRRWRVDDARYSHSPILGKDLKHRLIQEKMQVKRLIADGQRHLRAGHGQMRAVVADLDCALTVIRAT